MDARNFLHKVIAWPSPDDPGFAALVWWSANKDQTNPNQDRHKLWSSRCFRDPDAMLNFARFLMTKENNKDIYFCTALLNEHGDLTKSGKAYKAKRLARNVLNHKCLFADIDVKPGAYGSLREAFNDLTRVVTEAQLPRPDILVSSGSGGLHCYWCFQQQVSPTQWQRYAASLVAKLDRHGLKFDRQCSVDSVRILRLPQTLNWKHTPPAEVRVLGK